MKPLQGFTVPKPKGLAWTNLEMKGVNIYGGLPVLGNMMDALCMQSHLVLTTFHRTVEVNELSPVT